MGYAKVLLFACCLFVYYLSTTFFLTEAVKPTVEISGRVYVSGGDLVDMHVGDNLTAILTTPVNINCTARGIPKPKMTWKMNGQQLGNGGNYKTDNSGALAIKGVEDPGEFTCIAENFVGQDDASSFISLLGMFYMSDSLLRKEMIADKKSSILKLFSRDPCFSHQTTQVTVNHVISKCNV